MTILENYVNDLEDSIDKKNVVSIIKSLYLVSTQHLMYILLDCRTGGVYAVQDETREEKVVQIFIDRDDAVRYHIDAGGKR